MFLGDRDDPLAGPDVESRLEPDLLNETSVSSSSGPGVIGGSSSTNPACSPVFEASASAGARFEEEAEAVEAAAPIAPPLSPLDFNCVDGARRVDPPMSRDCASAWLGE